MKSLKFIIMLILLIVLVGCAPKGSSTGAVSVQWNGQVNEFNVRAFQFGYDPSTLQVNLGDKVRITAFSADVPHGLTIPAFGVDMGLYDSTPQIAEFIADKKGKFRFYCSVPCGAGHSRMQGMLVVN